MKKQFTRPIWKRCFTFALAAALVVQMIATPSLTAFAADDAAATISASDLKPEETPAVEEKTADETPAVEEKTVDETPAVEEAAEEVGAPALKVAPAVEEEPETPDAVTYLDADGPEHTDREEIGLGGAYEAIRYRTLTRPEVVEILRESM